jgi:hypothetical protein
LDSGESRELDSGELDLEELRECDLESGELNSEESRELESEELDSGELDLGIWTRGSRACLFDGRGSWSSWINKCFAFDHDKRRSENMGRGGRTMRETKGRKRVVIGPVAIEIFIYFIQITLHKSFLRPPPLSLNFWYSSSAFWIL